MKSKLTNVRISNLDPKDYPDFVDAFIESADCNGIPLTDEELDKLNEDSDTVYELVIKELYWVSN